MLAHLPRPHTRSTALWGAHDVCAILSIRHSGRQLRKLNQQQGQAEAVEEVPNLVSGCGQLGVATHAAQMIKR